MVLSNRVERSAWQGIRWENVSEDATIEGNALASNEQDEFPAITGAAGVESSEEE